MPDDEQLVTERLLLRRWRPADAGPMADVNRDPEVTRYLNRPVDEAVVAGFYEVVVGHWASRGYGPWAVEDRRSGTFVGFVGLADLPPFLAAAGTGPELGWRLARSAWGEGLATEASAAARDWAFDRLGLPVLVSVIHPDNARSARVATKLGMRRARSVDNPVLGRAVDVWELAADERA